MKKIVVAFFSLCIAIGICWSKDVTFNNMIEVKNIEILTLFAILSVFCYKNINIAINRKGISAGIVSIILTIFQTPSIHNYSKGMSYLFYIIKFLEYFGIFYIGISLLFDFIDKVRNENIDKNENIEKEALIQKKKINSLHIFFIVNIVVWLIYSLSLFPGMTNYDAMYQIRQAVGQAPLNNWHPIFHTMIFRFFLNIGSFIFKSYEAGLYLYNIFHMIIFNVAVTYFIYYLKKLNVNKKITRVLMFFITLNPIFPLISIYLLKDDTFAILFFIDLILAFKFILEKEKFLTLKNVIFSFIMLLITCMIRHNGIYVLILFVPFMCFLLKNKWKQILAFNVAIILIVKTINGPLIDILGIGNSSSTEMLSIPVQQIARVVTYNEDSLSPELKEEINKFFEYDVIKEKYLDYVSDPIKDSMRRDYYFANKVEFFKMYFKILFKYPKTCIVATIKNTYSYWSLERTRLKFPMEMYPNDLGIECKDYLNNPIVDYLVISTERVNMLFVSLLFNIGFILWIIIVLFVYLIYKKEYRKVCLFLPIFFLYLTILAGPVNCEFRYVSPVFISLPILIGMVFVKEEEMGIITN